jgi:aquaporin rerated protein, other eukaryote
MSSDYPTHKHGSAQLVDKRGLPMSPRTERKEISPLRRELIVGLGEFIGTFSFLFMAFGAVQVVSSAKAAEQGPGQARLVPDVFFIGAAFGTSLAVNVWIFYRVSGGIFNPAVRFLILLS